MQCSSHPLVHVVTERYRQEVFVVDTFMYPAKEMALLVRRDVAEPKSLGIVAAARGYPDLTRWESVTEESANPVVARNLLEGQLRRGRDARRIRRPASRRSARATSATARSTPPGSCTGGGGATRAS